MRQLVYYDVADGIVPELVADLPREALEYGQFKVQRNVRPGPGGVVKRGGLVPMTPDAPASGAGVHYGGGLFQFGADTLVAVEGVLVSGSVRLYTAVYTFSTDTWGAWSEATAASGKWGNTRMATPTRGYLQMAAISGQDGTEVVVVQNGIEAARMVDLSVRDARTVEDVVPCDAVQAYSPLFTFLDTLPVASTAGGSVTMTDSGASVTTSVVTVGTIYHWRAVFAAPAVGEWAQWELAAGSAIDLRNSRGVQLFVKATDDNWRGAIKISIVVTDGAGTKVLTVYDPSAQFVSMAEAATVDEGVVLIQLPVEEHPDADIDALRGIRIDVVAAGLAATYTFDIRGVAASGNVPGGAQYGVSLKNSGTRTESPGAPYRVFNPDQNVDEFRERNRIARLLEGRVPRGAAVGFEDVFTDGPYFFMPVVPEMYYNVELPLLAPTSAEGAKGVDYAVVYRKDPGSKSFSFVAEVQLAEYDAGAGAWETLTPLFASNASWKARAVYEDNAKSSELEEKRRLPDSQALAIPIGFAMAVVDKRLNVGVSRGTGSPLRQNALMVSEEDRPTMFRPFPRFEGGVDDASSGYLIALGDEDVTAIHASSASGLGSNTSYVFSNRRVQVHSGFKLFPLANAGTVAPQSVCEQAGTLFWIDQQNVQRSMRSGLDDLSSYRVQTLLDDTPASRRKFYSAVVARDLMMVARTAAAQSRNERALVYSQRFERWVSEDKKASAKFPQQFVLWEFFGEFRVAAFGQTGQLFEYDVSGELQDDGEGIEVVWESGAVSAEFGRSAVYGRMGVVAQATSESLATDRIPVRKAEGSHPSSDGTLSLVSAHPFAVAWDQDADNNPPMMRDVACGGKLSATLSEELFIKRWVQQVEGRVGDGPS